MSRHSSFGAMAAGLAIGMAVAATGAIMLCESKGMRGTKRSFRRVKRAFGELADDVKNMIG